MVDVESPHLDRLIGEAQLREWDAHLRRPAESVDVRLRFPHGVEPAIDDILVVGGVIPIESHARRSDAERVGRPPIVVTVERHPEVLGLVGVIAP